MYTNFSETVQNRIAIILPAFNEEQTIEKTIRSFYEHCPQARIYVVNNNSTDGTFAIAERTLQSLNAGQVLTEERQGKGYAVRKAFHEVDADVYVMADADLTYPAHEIHDLIRPVLNKQCDMAVGNRFHNHGYVNENKRLFHNFGNGLVRTLINRLFRVNLVDIMSGYRAFNKKFVKNWPVMSPGFEIEVEMTLHCLDKRFVLREVPIEYKDRPAGSFSKLNTFSDGLRVLRTIFSIFKDVRPFLFFGTLAVFCFVLGLGFGSIVLFEYYQTQYITRVPLAILSTGLMILSSIFLAIALILDSVVKLQKFNYEHRLIN
jgi:glycosyltransferase involved in cell wall biosynthesis